MTDSHNLANFSPSEGALTDKIILVTGAGDGIGRAVALAYARYGATVVLAGRTLSKLEKTYDEIEEAGYAKPAIFAINLEHANEHDYVALFDALNQEFGVLHGILHNAGELGPRTPIQNYSLSEWQKVLNVNLTAPFLMSKALLPLLKKAENSSIIFTSSSVAKKARAYWGAYAVSKAASENLSQLLADECDEISTVRVNSINPGAVRTAMRAKAYPAEDPATLKTAEEILPGYIYLMSDESKDINGQQFDAQENTGLSNQPS